MKNKKSTKKLTVALLALLGVISSGATYAYWQGSVSGATNNATATIQIGQAQNVETVVNVSNFVMASGKELVPANKIQNTSTQVDKVEFEFDVEWKEESVVDFENVKSVLTVGVGNITIGGDVKNNALVVVDFATEYTDVLINSTTKVAVTVTLTEPETKEIYDEIINKAIVVPFTFSVAAVA